MINLASFTHMVLSKIISKGYILDPHFGDGHYSPNFGKHSRIIGDGGNYEIKYVHRSADLMSIFIMLRDLPDGTPIIISLRSGKGWFVNFKDFLIERVLNRDLTTDCRGDMGRILGLDSDISGPENYDLLEGYFSYCLNLLDSLKI